MDTNKIYKCLENINKLIDYKKSLLEKYKGSRATLYIKSEINTLNELGHLLHDITIEWAYSQKEVRELRDENQDLKGWEEAYYVISDLYTKTLEIETEAETEAPMSHIDMIKNMKTWKQKRMQSTNN